MPASMCARAGSSDILCVRTSASHSVFTNVVRPVPDAPASRRQPPAQTKGVRAKKRTDDHHRELDPLLDLVGPAPARERHGASKGGA